MNPSVALVICTAFVGLAVFSLILGVRSPKPSWPPQLTLGIVVAVLAWIGGGAAIWIWGGSQPQRPGIFAGYAATAIGLAVLALPGVGRIGGRASALMRVGVLMLLAFVCWRTETVWLGTALYDSPRSLK